MSVLQQTVSLAAQLRAFSSLLSLPSQAQSVIKAFRRQGIGSADEFNTARFLLSRLESLSALLQVFQIFRGRAGRDCVFHFFPATDSPETRFSVMAAVVLSGCMCQSRKDPYLPLEPQCVRLLPRPTGLPARCSCQPSDTASQRRKSVPTIRAERGTPASAAVPP